MAIARVVLPVAADKAFDYWVPDGLAVGPGSIVRVELARRPQVGVVVEVVAVPATDPMVLQPIREVVTALPALPEDLLGLARFVAGYYQAPLGQVLGLAVPPLGGQDESRRPADEPLELTDEGRTELAVRLKRSPRARAIFGQWAAAPAGLLPVESLRALPARWRAVVGTWVAAGWARPVVPPCSGRAGAAIAELNPEQRNAVDAIVDAAGTYRTFLLQGITGSGKTEIYLATAAAAIDRGEQVLLLVPEINLTPQLERRVRAALPGRRLDTLHSALAAGLRRQRWREASAGHAELVLGTRLAVFSPLPRLGLVIVDEEHDPSFKQQDSVRYHARDVAVWRARQRGIPCVLGSATPALETLLHARQGRYSWLHLTRRAVAPARLPSLQLVADPGEAAAEGLSSPLRDAIALRLARGEQSLVFVNRRGYAPSLLCSACGWQAGCPRCSARLVVHRDDALLRCHHCGHAERLPLHCPDCGNADVLPLGHGTQRLERALAAAYPAARIARIDRDSMRHKGSFAALQENVLAGDVDILVGTQMLAKGHDFPRLTLVGILGADNALFSADFRATERLAALLLQVAGRAGRAQWPGEVIVQTRFPRHPLYVALTGHDYDAIAATLLAERRVAGLPPFAHLALLVAEAPQRASVDDFLARAHRAGHERVGDADVEVFPPVPASLARRAGMERGQVLVRSGNRAALQRFLAQWTPAIEDCAGRRIRWSLDVDPIGFA